MGTPSFSVYSLEALQDAGHTLQAVYTQPPRPAGRGHKEKKSPVHEAVENMGIAVRTPARLKGEALEALLQPPCDVIVVVGYGMLLPQKVLDHAPCINVHPSALPRWRGPAPIQYALLHGDTYLDICIMQLELGMDTGPVYMREAYPLPADATFGDVNDSIWRRGAQMLTAVLDNWGAVQPVPQAGEATYSKKFDASFRAIEWSDTAENIHNKIRSLSPTPGAVCSYAGEQIKVVRTAVAGGLLGNPGEIMDVNANGIVVACGEGAVVIQSLQRAGRQAMASADFLRGFPLNVGDVLQ